MEIIFSIKTQYIFPYYKNIKYNLSTAWISNRLYTYSKSLFNIMDTFLQTVTLCEMTYCGSIFTIWNKQATFLRLSSAP
jgi:hypothetical protein